MKVIVNPIPTGDGFTLFLFACILGVLILLLM